MPRKKNTPDEVILDAARDVFLSDGVGASTKKIAEKAGVSEGILFQRYGSKQVLFFKSMRLPPPDLAEAIDLCRKSKQPLDALLVLANATLDYLRNIMPMFLLVLSHPSREEVFKNHEGQAHELLFEAFGLSQIFTDYFQLQVNNKILRKRDYETLTGVLLSTLLTRVLHEQIGLDSIDSSQSWLESTIRVIIE